MGVTEFLFEELLYFFEALVVSAHLLIELLIVINVILFGVGNKKVSRKKAHCSHAPKKFHDELQMSWLEINLAN